MTDTSGLGGAQRPAVFAVDFGAAAARRFCQARRGTPAPCWREREARPRPILQGSVSHEDRRRIAAFMEQRGVTVRGGKRLVSPPPPASRHQRRHSLFKHSVAPACLPSTQKEPRPSKPHAGMVGPWPRLATRPLASFPRRLEGCASGSAAQGRRRR